MDTDVALLDPEKVSADELIELRDMVGHVSSAAVKSFLTTILVSVESGKGVAAASTDREVSPEFAAGRLGMSRPHLYKLLKSGEIPSRRVGTHHRIRISDLLAYQLRLSAARADLAESFATTDQDRLALTADLAGVDVDTARRLGF